MGYPTDGFGIYESINPSQSYTSRLSQIAAGGFKVVMNYLLLRDTTAHMIAYINAAATYGLKVAVALHDPRIWKTNQYGMGSPYQTMFLEAGSPSTPNAFAQYVVNQVKSLPGVWGYYIGDEIDNSDHTTFQPYAAAIASADSTHPRLMIASGSSSSSVASGTNLFYDCCEVMGDDYYPIGQPSNYYSRTLPQQASQVQSFVNSKGLQSSMSLQSHNLLAYGVSTGVWPTELQMQQARNDALNNLGPRLLLWYSYFDVITTSANQWAYLTNAVGNRHGTITFNTTSRRTAPKDYGVTVLADSPYAYYRLDDVGLLIYDKSGNLNSGVASSTGVTYSQSGALSDTSTSIRLDGANGYVLLPPDLNGSGWSNVAVECWVKFSSFPSVGNFYNILHSKNLNNGYELFIDSNHNVIFGVGNGTNEFQAAYTLPGFGSWYHLVGTYDGLNVRLYVNGVLQATTPLITGSIGTLTIQPVIGTNAGSHSLSFYSGYVDEVAIYKNSVLSSSQVTKHYNTGLGLTVGNTILFPSTDRRQS